MLHSEPNPLQAGSLDVQSASCTCCSAVQFLVQAAVSVTSEISHAMRMATRPDGNRWVISVSMGYILAVASLIEPCSQPMWCTQVHTASNR